MTAEEIYPAWFAAKAGIIEFSSLAFVRRITSPDGERYGFGCPCGGDDHVATIPMVCEGMSNRLGDVLTCYETNQQWLVRRPDVAAVIGEEEEEYIRLIERAPDIVKKVVKRRGWSDATAAFLKDTHGIDREIAEEVIQGEIDGTSVR